jgi:transcriptional regulator with XRE-family HTH domain
MEQEATLTPENIKEWRESNNMTQQQLSELLGTGVATIARWEAGTAKPTGTASAILTTVLTGSKLKGKDFLKVIPLIGGSILAGYGIYKLLSQVFENEEN